MPTTQSPPQYFTWWTKGLSCQTTTEGQLFTVYSLASIKPRSQTVCVCRHQMERQAAVILIRIIKQLSGMYLYLYV